MIISNNPIKDACRISNEFYVSLSECDNEIQRTNMYDEACAILHKDWKTTNEYFSDKEREKEARKEERLEEKYFKELFKLVSDEDYIRFNIGAMEDSKYDGSEYQCIWEEEENISTFIKHKFGTVKALDTKYRKGRSINVELLLTKLCEIHEIRDVIYDNDWGISVTSAKLSKYPERKELGKLASILMDGIESHEGYFRRKYLLWWSAAPEGTVANKCWNCIPSLEYSDMDQVIDWQKNLDSFKPLTEEEVVSDKLEWTYEMKEAHKRYINHKKHMAIYELSDTFDNGNTIVYK
jgi:hypothetical protein